MINSSVNLISGSESSSVVGLENQQAVTAFIQVLPKKKRLAASELLMSRQAFAGNGAIVSHWYPEFNGLVFCRPTKSQRIHFMGFAGKRSKPDFNYLFQNMEQFQDYLKSWYQNQISRIAQKEAGKAQRATWLPNVKESDIFVSSWGYEQTNIDYYQVVALCGKKTVLLREICKQSKEMMPMQGACVPLPNHFVNEIIIKKQVQQTGPGREKCYVRINSYQTAYLKIPEIIAGMTVFEPDYWTAYY